MYKSFIKLTICLFCIGSLNSCAELLILSSNKPRKEQPKKNKKTKQSKKQSKTVIIVETDNYNQKKR